MTQMCHVIRWFHSTFFSPQSDAVPEVDGEVGDRVVKLVEGGLPKRIENIVVRGTTNTVVNASHLCPTSYPRKERCLTMLPSPERKSRENDWSSSEDAYRKM